MADKDTPTLSATPTLAELKAMYDQLGASQAVHGVSEQGDTVDYTPVQYGNGWTAWDKAPEIVGYQDGSGGGEGGDQPVPIYDDKKQLGGFAKQEGDVITSYDLAGNVVKRETMDHDSFLKGLIKDLGPMAMMALTAGGGAGLLGESLFGLTGAGASAAGGALAGGVNAWGNDQNILKGAALGGLSGAGSAKLSDIVGADALGDTFKNAKVGDVTKAINFAQNPTLAGAANIASPYMPNLNVGDSGISLNDILKGAGTAKALGSGDYNQIFKAITGMAGDQGKSLKTSLGPGDMEQFSADLIPGYFQPGGEGYDALMAGDTTVLEDPQNLDAFLRSISPYATDSGKSIFTQTEDVPEMETVSKRPITSIESILGNPDILQQVEADVPELTITDKKDEPYIPGIRTKDIVSDIPDAITPDQIDKLFPNIDINSILQTVPPGGTKVVTPTKTVIPTTATPGTKTVQQSLASLGLGGMQQGASQDPYADIKLMEDMFGPDIAYKLLSLGGNKRK